MAQYEPGMEMIAAENRSGWLQSELIDVAVFGLFFVLSALFVIMAGYFVMAWL